MGLSILSWLREQRDTRSHNSYLSESSCRACRALFVCGTEHGPQQPGWVVQRMWSEWENMLARVYQELLRLPLRLHLSGVTALEMSSSGELRLHFSPARAQIRTPSDWTGPTDSTAGWDTLTRGCSHCPQIEQEIKGLVHPNYKFTPVNCLQYHKGPSWLLSPNIQNTDALRLYDVSAALRDAVCFYWVFQSVRVFNLWISCRSLPLHRAERRVRSAWAQSLHPACVSVGLSGYSFMKLLWTLCGLEIQLA